MKTTEFEITKKTVTAIATYLKAVEVKFKKGFTVKNVPTAYYKSGPRKGKPKAWKTMIDRPKYLFENSMPKFEVEVTACDGNAEMTMKLLNPLQYDEDYVHARCLMLKNGKLTYSGRQTFSGRRYDIPCFNDELKQLAKDKNFKAWANKLMAVLLSVAAVHSNF